MDVLDGQALKLAILEPCTTGLTPQPFAGMAAEQLDPGEIPWQSLDPNRVSIQAALTGETRIGTDALAASSATTGALAVGDSITGFVNTRGDHDWFRIQFSAGNTYQINLNRVAGRDGLADPFLALRDGNGELITENDDAGSGQNSAIFFTATRSDTYFLDASAFNDGYIGQYQLKVSRVSSDQYAANTSTTGSIDPGGSMTSTIDSRGDHDWFKITLTAGKNYIFNLNKVGNRGLSDPLLNLRNGSGAVITSNDDANGTLNSQINFTATSTGTYFLDAGSYGDRFTGQYQLLAAEAAPTPNGYSVTTGYGEANVRRALESLLNTSLPSVTDLGGIFWGLDRLGAPEAWAAGYTGTGITVAVVDTGVDYTHSDLAGNIWINSGEIPGNGIDDDGNGFIDDVRGWNFDANTNNVMDDNSHGTHVAGTIAGENNGVEITGVAYNAKIMPVKVLNGSGSGTLTAVANGIRYAANNGAKVINLSLGGGGSAELLDAVSYATSRGAVVVMAAGNEGAASPSYPGSYAQSYGLAVGAIDSAGSLASFSNRAGITPIDYITAAGVEVYSSVPGNGYATYSGTSMATPHIAGAMALLQQANIQNNKGLTVAALETLLTSTASNMVTASTLSQSSTPRATTSTINGGSPQQNGEDPCKARARDRENRVGRAKEVLESIPLLENGLWQRFRGRGTSGPIVTDPRGASPRLQSVASGLSGATPQSSIPDRGSARSLIDVLVSTVNALTETHRSGSDATDPLTGLGSDLRSARSVAQR